MSGRGRALHALWLAFALAACGGGGGGDSGGGNSAALSFSPSVVRANVAEGSSATVTVRATAADASLFSGVLYVYVVDAAHVLAPALELAAIDSRTMSATLHTAPTLPLGRHQGSFQVQLCRDSQCASQYPGSPVALPYDLTVTAAPLSAVPMQVTSRSVHHGGSLSERVDIAVAGPHTAWTASTDAAWLDVGQAAGDGAGTFGVGFRTADLPEGDYAGTVTVRSNDGQSVGVPFTLHVLPTAFVVSNGTPTFSAVNGAPIGAQPLSFALDNDVASPWTAATSAAWLTATPTSGTTPAQILLQPDPRQGPLASGSYSANLLLSSPGAVSKTVAAQLSLTAPSLSAVSPVLTFGGPRGRDLTAVQSASVSLNTGQNRWPFAVSGLPDWLSTNTPSGTVGQTAALLPFTPIPSAVTPGSRSATVMVRATVNGDSAELPLTMNINADQRRLLASEWGIALTRSPHAAMLSRTIRLVDNFGQTLSWTASSDAAWLSVTASGITGDNVTIHADEASLPDESVSYANVTFTPTVAGVTPAVVRVAFWKSNITAPATTKLPLDYRNIVADRIRPYVYLNNGSTGIDVYNAYSAQKVRTISGVGAALGKMAVSMDGSRLFALDTAARALAVIDLGTMTRVATWALDSAVAGSTSVLAVRPNGVDVVLVGDGTAYVEGRSLGATSLTGKMVTVGSGQAVVTLGARYALDYSEMSGGVLFVTRLNFLDGHSGGNLRDVAANSEGSRFYEASGGGVSDGGYKCAIMDASGSYVGALPGGEAYPNNVEVTRDGRPICGISGWYSTYDFWVHSPDGALLAGYKVAGYAREVRTDTLVVTPDGTVVVALTDDPFLAFVPIGQ